MALKWRCNRRQPRATADGFDMPLDSLPHYTWFIMAVPKSSRAAVEGRIAWAEIVGLPSVERI